MKQEVVEWLKALLSSLIIVGLILFFIRPTLVKGDSMYPTIKEYNYLIIEKMSYRFAEPDRGDIIVFKSELRENLFKNKDLIKRVVAKPGDNVRIFEGKVFLNDQLLEEDYINEPYTYGQLDVVVPEGSVFVMGDNRGVSRDSRDDAIGFVDYDRIRGKIFIRLFPFKEIGLVKD